MELLKKAVEASGTPMIPKTAFLEVLEDIHKRTDQRYGQIISNALATRFKTRGCDCGKDFMTGCKCKNDNGRGFNTFAIWDEDLTDILDDYKARLFPDEKKPVRKKPKVPPGTISKAELKRMDSIVDKMVKDKRARS